MEKRDVMGRKQDTYGVDHLVLCFGKALTGKAGELLCKHKDSWVALGYFDTLQIYSLPRSAYVDNWVYGMLAEEQRLAMQLDGDFYFHPVHIMSHSTEREAKKKQTFLETGTAYLAVTFVQAREITESDAAFQMENKLEKVLEDGLDARNRPEWVIYETLNLSDLIILWKADSLNAILDAIHFLYIQPEVGDLHTIPAIRFDTVCGDLQSPQAVKEYIPRVISRYLIKDPYNAKEFFQEVSKYLLEKPYLTTGMEDVSVVMENVCTQDLRNTIAARLTHNNIVSLYGKAFSETEIHLCLEEVNSNKIRPVKDNLRLVNYCENLQNGFQKEKKRLLKSAGDVSVDMSWLKVAGELYNALLDMSRNPVEDGFCFLILESARMFCQKLQGINLPSSEQIMRIQRFLRGWGTLMEQSMRMDGKFNQQPGFSPALCQIPSRLLELYLAFNAHCCKLICKQADDDYQFCFLLVPKLCRRIKVEVVFFDKPPCDRLLYVDVPSDLLYEPEYVMAHLCHEISHFCGESWRLRDKRKDAYLHICANELAYALGLSADQTIDLIYQDLNVYEYTNGFYLRNLQEESLIQCQALLEDISAVQKWIDTTRTCANSPLQEYLDLMQVMADRQELLLANQNCRRNPQGDFFYVMEEITFLFKECYADISMIYILQLSAEQYFMLSKKETMLYNRMKTENNLDYDLAVERWAIVLYTVFQERAMNMLRGIQDDVMCEFAKDILSCMVFFCMPSKEWDMDVNYMMIHYHRRSSIYFLRRYLKSCYQKMRNSASQQDVEELKKLRNVFRKMTEQYDFTDQHCHGLLQEYRQDLLRDL